MTAEFRFPRRCATCWSTLKVVNEHGVDCKCWTGSSTVRILPDDLAEAVGEIVERAMNNWGAAPRNSYAVLTAFANEVREAMDLAGEGGVMATGIGNCDAMKAKPHPENFDCRNWVPYGTCDNPNHSMPGERMLHEQSIGCMVWTEATDVATWRLWQERGE